jgi:hypothetical protein
MVLINSWCIYILILAFHPIGWQENIIKIMKIIVENYMNKLDLNGL